MGFASSCTSARDPACCGSIRLTPVYANLCVSAGLTGDGFLYLLETVKRKVVQPNARVVPAGATLYCMGLEILTPRVLGFDLSPLDQYRCE